jgi:hypothetical protein
MDNEQEERAETKTVVLYPRHIAYVKEYGKRTTRNFSNAVQRIIEEHAEQDQQEESK